MTSSPPARVTLLASATRAFTLLELIVAMSIVTVLFGAMASAILISTKALPDDDSTTIQLLKAGRVAEKIALELQGAKTITVATATTLEFTVADRSVPADGNDETIRYEWSGTPSDPLTRQYNGGSTATILEKVQAFDLAYKVESLSTTETAPGIEGSEQLLVQQDSTNTASNYDYAISSDDRYAETFLPTLPGDAISWRVTRIQAYLKKAGGPTGQIAIGFAPVTGSGEPGSPVEEAVVLESSLPDGWYEQTFTSVGQLDPATRGALIIRYIAGGGQVAKVKAGFGAPGGAPNTTMYMDDGSGTWWAHSDAIFLQVWGTYTIPDPDWIPPSNSVLCSAQITINTGATAQSQVMTATLALNEPAFP